ncbi:MAG: polyprenyl synthetase family protein [Anaerolineae bacterium]|nr:polyprenyl synthetase family protein [Anaerolineae bacterium]
MTITTTGQPTTSQTQWLDAVQPQIKLVEARMLERAQMGHGTLDDAISLLIQAGGKRLRPAITLLTGRLLGAELDALVSVAASVELLHTATLVHDDLVDGAETRRGMPTLHSQYSAGVTVLTGDFLFAQAAHLAAEANNVAVVQLFAETLVRIVKGEIVQAQTRWQVPEYDVYIERIYGKTAALFEAAAESAALVAGSAPRQRAALARYGRLLGLGFQIIDDALDFLGTNASLGKPAGNDMRQGIFNLPVLFYVQQGHMSATELTERVANGEGLADLVADMRAAGVVEQSINAGQNYAQQALAELELLGQPDEALELLTQITAYAVARSS